MANNLHKHTEHSNACFVSEWVGFNILLNTV